MNKQGIRKYQMSQLKLLDYFDCICREMQLKYFLVFGTLLGAIRHKGFIPWDADIDVAMYRTDYEALRSYFIKQPNPDLYYEHYENEKNHISPHAILKIKGTHVVFGNKSLRKIEQKNDGIYIDIFPIDNIKDPDLSEIEQVKKIIDLRRLVYLKTAIDYDHTNNRLKEFGKILVSLALSPISYYSLNAKTDKIMNMYNDTQTDYVGILTDPLVYRKQLYPRNVFGSGKEAEFEGHSFFVPSEPEQFLAIRYGDYMKLPPESERWRFIETVIESVDYGDTHFLHDIEY